LHEPTQTSMPEMLTIRLKLSCEKRLTLFKCPAYLTERLLEKGIFQDVNYINELFEEWKKYVILSMIHPEISLPMISTDVDKIWHNFILFTRQYHDFCTDILGINYFHHAPSISGEISTSVSGETFSQLYNDKFGEEISKHWGDLSSCKSCEFTCSGRDCNH